MIFKIVILLIFMLNAYCSESHKKHSPKITNGILNLRNWDFNEDGNQNLVRQV